MQVNRLCPNSAKAKWASAAQPLRPVPQMNDGLTPINALLAAGATPAGAEANAPPTHEVECKQVASVHSVYHKKDNASVCALVQKESISVGAHNSIRFAPLGVSAQCITLATPNIGTDTTSMQRSPPATPIPNIDIEATTWLSC